MSHLYYYTGITLVDVTTTGVTRGGNEHERNQQRNWETVVQAIGIIAQPIEITSSFIFNEPEVELLEFGEFFTGKHRVWAWEWAVEHADVYADADGPVGQLEKCFDQIPIITGLDETARFMLPIFYPYGSIQNIRFIDRSVISKIK